MGINPKLKTVCINGRFLTQPATGVQRYANQLIRGWDKMLDQGEIDPQQYQIEVLTPKLKRPITPYKNISIRQVGYFKGNLWEQVELPFYSRGQFLFNPGNIGPLLKMNQAVTIHDTSVFAVPYSYSASFLFKYRLVYTVLAKTARLVITVSNFSKNELIKYCRIPSQKLVVIPEGSDHILSIEADRRVFTQYNIGEKPYILTVGTNAPHKNLEVIYQAAAMLAGKELEFVVVGSDFDRWFNTPSILVNERCKKPGYIPDAALKALYQGAVAFIFPSLYEGFGLPPLEAMACGCPVIASNASSIPEVCANAALYFNPRQPGELVEQINCLINDPVLQSELREKGYSQARRFQWSNTSKSTWELLVKYCNHPK
jgi:glycosyltransferase involved in cell wall biosynthesis